MVEDGRPSGVHVDKLDTGQLASFGGSKAATMAPAVWPLCQRQRPAGSHRTDGGSSRSGPPPVTPGHPTPRRVLRVGGDRRGVRPGGLSPF